MGTDREMQERERNRRRRAHTEGGREIQGVRLGGRRLRDKVCSWVCGWVKG